MYLQGYAILTYSQRSSESHVLLGAVLVVLFLLMPVVGWLHHRHFVATGAKDFKSALHVWGGRVLLLVSLANGITGLQLSKENNVAYIAYGVVAGIFVLAYAAMLYIKSRRVETVVDEMELPASSWRK